MKEQLSKLLQDALERFAAELPADTPLPGIQLERTRDATHGDFASNLAMMLAKPARRAPRQIAEALVAELADDPLIAQVEIAGPGFINFRVSETAWQDVIREIHAAGDSYGHASSATGAKTLVEFVSANPTGPLHVGHGRGAAYGDTIANLRSAAGDDVTREYYVNDAGRQMDILTTSVWLRYLAAGGSEITFPVNAYQGDYITGEAKRLRERVADRDQRSDTDVLDSVPPDEPDGGDKEAHIDGLIANAKALLGDDYEDILKQVLDAQVADIRDDLAAFGVEFDNWYSERSLTGSGAVDRALKTLADAGHSYEKDGAIWFRSSDFGDEKDRVLVRDNGSTTYFASDIAYHLDKLDRGFTRLVDIWGADHHGYVPRVAAAVRALGADADALDVKLVQFVSLFRDGEKLSMSTRAGQYVTLSELRDEVGTDAARFFYVMRSNDQHLDFDLDLAKSESNENPVYYLQYAHARVSSVFEQMGTRGLTHDNARGLESLAQLSAPHEAALMRKLSRLPEIVLMAADQFAPHTLVHYLREVADAFHSYYNAEQFLVDDEVLRDARLSLVLATRQVLRNGLALLGVSAPERM